jgi:hypothetical protein
VRAILGEERRRDRLAVADDLAEHDVGAVAHRHRVHPLERLAPDPVVVVDEEHELAAGDVDADVARAPRPARVGDVADADVLVLRRQLVEPRRRRIGRAVVDEDDLVVAARQGLVEQRPDAVVDQRSGVVDRHDDADLGPVRGRPPDGFCRAPCRRAGRHGRHVR